MRFRGSSLGPPRAGSAAVLGAGGQAGEEQPGPGGEPIPKHGPDALLAGGPDCLIREVEPGSGLLYVVSFLAIFFYRQMVS